MKFTIPNYIFIIIYGAIMAVITVIMAIRKLEKENESKWYLKFTRAGWLTIGLLIL